jgi:hypothetical protein
MRERWLTFGLTCPPRRRPPRTGAGHGGEVAASLHVWCFSPTARWWPGENRPGLGRPKAIRQFFAAERVPLPAKAVQVAAGEDTSFALLDEARCGPGARLRPWAST